LNDTEFIVNTLYELKDMKPLVNTNIPKSKYRNSIKGLAFYPERSGTKLIYLYSNCTNIKQNPTSPSSGGISTGTDASNDVSMVFPKESVKLRKAKIIAPSDSIEAVFRMKQTETVDVYNLYLSKIIHKKGKKFVKYIKFGIACVQTIECSYFCKDLFNSAGKDTVLVKCKYHPDKDKWIPFSSVEGKKIPDDYDEINKHFTTSDNEDEDEDESN